MACSDVIVHVENPSQVYKVHPTFWAKAIAQNGEAEQYGCITFQRQKKGIIYGEGGKTQGSADALSLRILELPQRVFDPLTRFGRERLVRDEINFFSFFRASVHRVLDE